MNEIERDLLYKQASDCFKNKQDSQAKEICLNILAECPSHEESIKLFCHIERIKAVQLIENEGKYDEAVEIIKEIQDKYPKNGEPNFFWEYLWTGMIELLEMKGKYDVVETICNKNPENPNSPYHKGLYELAKGNWNKAVEYWKILKPPELEEDDFDSEKNIKKATDIAVKKALEGKQSSNPNSVTLRKTWKDFKFIYGDMVTDEKRLKQAYTLKTNIDANKAEIEIAEMVKEYKEKYPFFKNFIGQSEPVLKLFKEIEPTLNSSEPVIILGESGSGKELIAKMISNEGKYSGKPFKVFNCAQMTSSIAESELFGHVKGAYTGADKTTIGLFESADDGIIFLDEIGDLSLDLQAKILRTIENKEIRKVGSTESIIVNVRVICATNKQLYKMVENGQFREDLYFRLNIHVIKVPSLLDRPLDIPLLAKYFAHEKQLKILPELAVKIGMHYMVNRKYKNELKAVSVEGNVREIRNRIYVWATRTQSEIIDYDSLPDNIKFSFKRFILMANATFDNPYNMNLDSARVFFFVPPEKTAFLNADFPVENKQYWKNLLIQNKGNISAISKVTGIPESTIRDRLEKYSLDPDKYREKYKRK